MDIKDVLKSNYLPYGKGVILSRAFPDIDGLKTVQRRILYDMYELGTSPDKKRKSARIVGDTMGKYHPHGDSSIYGTLVCMSDKYKGFNVPYISGKGNLGDVRSTTVDCAAMRYTEAGLSDSALKTLFDGITENAVDFVPNFDETEKEPVLLPSKYPNIIVNGVSGIGVGISNNIPSWSLLNVCMTTAKFISGSYEGGEGIYEMAQDLGCLEYPTGGNVHATDEEILKIVRTGAGKVTLTGKYKVFKDRIRIYEIPYTTTIEAIMSDISALAKTKFKSVSELNNITGLNQVGLDVKFKRGADVDEIIKNLLRYTSFRSVDSVKCNVIVNNECKLRTIPELLTAWVEFRVNTLRRIYQFRLDKKSAKKHLLESWAIIKDDIDEFISILRKNKKADAKELVTKRFNLDSDQVDYLFDLGISTITPDMADKKLRDVEKITEEVNELQSKVNSDDLIKQDIMNELLEVAKEFSSPKKTALEAPVELPDDNKEVISDEYVNVYLTKSGCLKRLKTMDDMYRFRLREGDEVIDKYYIKNNEYLLVFTSKGEIHKIMVNNIDASRGVCRETIAEMLRLEVDNRVVYVDEAGDYSKHINIIYKDGRGYVLRYTRAKGKREKYINCYEELIDGQYSIIAYDKFFTITNKRKAQYIDLSTILFFCDKRTAIRIIRVNDKSGDIIGLQPADAVPDISKIDLNRYSKGYAVSIKDDILFESQLPHEENEEADENNSEPVECEEETPVEE